MKHVAAPKQATTNRVLRYTGKDPSAVDPYWDFEHLLGELYDSEALRVWRLRVFVSKPARARLSIARTEDAPEGTDTESIQHPLTAHDHIVRYNGGPEREAASYEKLTGSLVAVSPPSTTFAIHLTGLDPGAFLVRANVLGAQQQEREMKFRIVRRPFYTYPGLTPGKAPVVRSHTGILRARQGERMVSTIGYRWTVDRWEWGQGDYQTAGSRRVDAEVVLGEGPPRWRIGGETHLDLNKDPPRAWAEYESMTGIGLEPPRLVGVPSQRSGR